LLMTAVGRHADGWIYIIYPPSQGEFHG